MGSCLSVSAHIIHSDPLVREYAGDLFIPIIYKGKNRILKVEKGTKYALILPYINGIEDQELRQSETI